MTTIAAPRRVLIVALDNLGDTVFASALTPPLHTAFPNATIDVWSKAYTAPVARLIPHVTNVIAADPFWAQTPNHSRAPVLPFAHSVLAVRRGRYDLAIVSNAPWRTAAAVAATGIPMRIGLARRRNERWLTRTLTAEDPKQPVVTELLRLLEPLGIVDAVPRYMLDGQRLERARRTVAAQLAARFVALHPFAGDARRCLPLQEWTQVAFVLAERGVPVLWVGAPAELARVRGMTHPRGFYSDQLGDGSLSSTAAALSLAVAFIGHDSGPLHVAGALGVPVVGVFAPGEPERTFPQGIGPSQLIARTSPRDIDPATLLRALDELDVFSAA